MTIRVRLSNALDFDLFQTDSHYFYILFKMPNNMSFSCKSKDLRHMNILQRLHMNALCYDGENLNYSLKKKTRTHIFRIAK